MQTDLVNKQKEKERGGEEGAIVDRSRHRRSSESVREWSSVFHDASASSFVHPSRRASILESIGNPSRAIDRSSRGGKEGKRGKRANRVSFLAPFAVVIHASNIGNTFILWRISGRRMNKTVHYALVAFWEKSGCKIVADYPAKQDPTYREIALSTVDGLKSVENDKISFDRGK